LEEKINLSNRFMLARFKIFLLGKENIVLLGILVIASFLRLYKIAEYMTFLGDEGRDVLVVKQILEGELTLLGPRSSAADFYYGPIYYYLITPFLWIFKYDPVGPAVFIGILGVITVYLIFLVGRRFFGVVAGLIAALLYAISPVVIAYSHSSWNPNPLPFVSLMTLYILYLAVKGHSIRRFFIVGLLLGVAMQLQYLALFLIVIVGFYLCVGTFIQEKKHFFLILIKRFVSVGIGFIIGWSPFLAFEVLHGFPNLRTLFNLLIGKYGEVVVSHTTPGQQVVEVFFKLFGRLITTYPLTDLRQIHDTQQLYFWYLATLVLGAVSVLFMIKIKDRLAMLLLLSWIVIGVALFAFYKKDIYDYYLGFMFPLPFLLVGNLISLPFKTSNNTMYKGAAVVLFLVLVVLNIIAVPFKNLPNKQKDQVREITEFVISKTENKPFNFGLITPGNSDHGYRYFMEILGHKPVAMQNLLTDPGRKSVADQLMVVCEDVQCSPLGNPLFEVAGFGRAEIVDEWSISVVKVFRLVHYKEN